MSSFHFFSVFFADTYVFLPLIFLSCAVLFLSVRKAAVAGYLDPIHFYWTFTFGTAYGIVAGLFYKGYVSTFYFLVVFASGFIFIVFFRFFLSSKNLLLPRIFILFCVPEKDGRSLFYLALIVYLSICFYLFFFVGAGAFAEQNRFESARGHGHFFRLVEAFRLFLIAYISILAYKKYKISRLSPEFVSLVVLLSFFAVFGALINGSKFSFLEAIYASALGIALFTHSVPKFSVSKSMLILGISTVFALLVLSINLKNNNFDTSKGTEYLAYDSVLIERLFFRVLGNADKYYLGLPNSVIEQVETDSVIVRLISPMVGVSNLSGILDYNVNDYNVGRQIILQHDPDRRIAGGPTSHFDLFSYKYFGLAFGWLWIAFCAFVISSIIKLKFFSLNNIFISAFCAALWLRCLPILLEPSVGLAYVIDIFVVFCALNLIVLFLRVSSGKPLT